MKIPPVIVRVLRHTGLLRNFNLTSSVTLAGRTIAVPLRGELGYDNLRHSDRYLIDLFRILLKVSAGSFLDVGANVGQTLLKVRALDANRPYLGFEPNPVCVGYLHALLSANGFTDADVLCCGLGRHTGLETLVLYSGNDADQNATVVQDFRPTSRIYGSFPVLITSTAEISSAAALADIAIVKVDVEGGELEVILGLSDAIARCRPYVVLEILPVYSQSFPERLRRQEALQSFFRDQDYVLFRLHHTPGGLTHLEEILEIGIHGDYGLSNYVSVPAERLEAFRSAYGGKIS